MITVQSLKKQHSEPETSEEVIPEKGSRANSQEQTVSEKIAMQSSKRPPEEPESSEEVTPEKRSRTSSQEQMVSEKEVLCDRFCWRCHKEGTLLECRVCPRSFHPRCDQQSPSQDSQWTCFECRRIMAAEDVDTRSPAMALLSVEQLRTLLKYALLRLKQNALIVFHNPVSIEEYPKYPDYIVHPMDLSQLDKNIRDRVYGCTEAFLADVKWILHNSIIFNGDGHRLTAAAKSVINACKQEMKEIEICPDCYLNAHTLKETWFIEPCRRAHVLVWAKMKGYPYWPGKALRLVNGNIDVRFFGAHDRAQVPQQLCFLLSYDMPQPLKSKKKAKFNVALEELELHLQKLRAKLGGFDYAPVRTIIDPEKLYLQPISKVTTGRRHSDADQSSQPKGRTVTIVTSSWMRKLQAEGGLVKSPVKEKKEKRMSSPPPMENSKLQQSRMMSSAPSPAMRMGYRIPRLGDIKSEQKRRSSGDRLNPPTGVFEISDRSLNIPQELDLKSSAVNMNVVPMPDMVKHRDFQSTLDKIQERILETLGDEEMDETGSSDEHATDAEKSDNNSVNNVNNSEGNNQIPSNSECVVEETEVPIEEENSSESSVSDETNEAAKQAWLENKTSCTFSKRLGQTIESCKAKLGIQEIEETADDRSDSEEDTSEEDSRSSESELPAATEEVNEINATDSPDNSSVSKVEELHQLDHQEKPDDEREPIVVEQNGSVHEENAKVVAPTVVPQDNVVSEAEQNDLSKKREGSTMSGEEDLVIDEEMEHSGQSETELPQSSPHSEVLANGTDSISSRAATLEDPLETSPLSLDVMSKQIPPLVLDTSAIPQLEISSDSDIANYAHKLIDFMKELGRDGGGNPQATIRSLELELEKQRWHHQQELIEIKHNTDLVLLEVRASLEIDKERALSELARKHYIEKNQAMEELKRKFDDERKTLEKDTVKEIGEIKKKQWCANCAKEAVFYCCWNTSYCDYPCQQSHWQIHQNTCGQLQGNTLMEVPKTRNMTNPKASITTPQLAKPLSFKNIFESSGHNTTPNTVHVTPLGNTAITKLSSPSSNTQQPIQVQYMPSSACYQLMAPNVTLSSSPLSSLATQGRNFVSIQAVTRPTTNTTTSPTIVNSLSVKTYGKLS